jgi:hypothetical protein
MKLSFSRLMLLAVVAAWQLPAGTIVQDVAGTGSGSSYFGVTFQTPAGGPWNNLTFNFFFQGPATTPVAAGTMYLVDQGYTGAPNGLGISLPGFIASTSSVVDGQWVFAPSVAVAPNTQYWVFEDTALKNIGGGGGVVANQGFYHAATASDNYAFVGSSNANFNFSGTDAAPEPSTLLLMVPALWILRRHWSR